MGEAKLPTYFIKNAGKMVSDELIRHYNLHQQQEVETRDWLPAGDITVGITAGASCPNNLIEDAIRRLFELRGDFRPGAARDLNVRCAVERFRAADAAATRVHALNLRRRN